MTAPSAVTGASSLGLHPFFVTGKGDRYTVITRVGRQAISTSGAGVEAIRLLARGHTVEETTRVLADRHRLPAGEINLAPLLETLLSSGFIRTLDGRGVGASAGRGRHTFRLWLTLFVWSPLLELVLEHVPSRLALPLVYWWFTRMPNRELERRIAANLRRAPGLDFAEGEVARIAAGNREALRKQFCDRLLLASSPARRLRRWLGQEVQVSGLEYLTRPAGSRRGTILCSFHLGSYGLIPFVLAARGAPVTVYAGFGGDARADVATWLLEQAGRGGDYPVRIVTGGMSLRTLARCLERGETVLLYCDQGAGEANRSPEARGRISVPFLGTRIWSARGVGWLAMKTGATLLPAALLWEGRRGHHLRIGPELVCGQGTGGCADADAVMVAVSGALERYVQQDPAQWLKWQEFDVMIAE